MKEMESQDVLDVLETFERSKVKVWVAGGWAVDALVGRQTRPHNDVDVAFDAKEEDLIIEAFKSEGYQVVDDARPTRFVLRKIDGTEIDMHPVVFEESGIGKQLVPDANPFVYPPDAFSVGFIDGHEIPCLSANQLVEFHTGYTPMDKDRHNMKVLHETLGIDLPDIYKASFGEK